MVACVIGVVGVVAAGCGGRTIGPDNSNHNDNGNVSDPDGGTPGPDAAPVTDGGVTPDSGVCDVQEWWELQATPLSEVAVKNPQLGGDGVPEGVTMRVEATLTVTGCDEPAGVQAEVYPDDRTVILAGYIWHYHGPENCPYLAEDVPEFLAFRQLRSGSWSLVDILINGPGVPLIVRACDANEDCDCDHWQGVPGSWGTACDFDCMCQGNLGCVYDQPTPTCYRTCSVTSDCPIPQFCNDALPQTAQGVCLSTGLIEECGSDADCAPGFACLPVEGTGQDWCQAAMATQPVGRPCDYHCDCPEGYSCVDMGEGGRTCQIRCRGNLDCPSSMVCDPRAAGSEFVANLLVCNFQ